LALPSFTVTTAHSKVKLDSSGAARGQFTVTNTSTQTLKGRLLTRSNEPARPEWFSIAGESVRDFTPNDPEQVDVHVSVPAGSPPGSYSFRLDAVSQVNPDEDFTVGPMIAFEVAAPEKPKRPIVPWILVCVGALVLLIIIAIVAAK
jgi:hypothetical protein